jgi:magnesium transporter
MRIVNKKMAKTLGLTPGALVHVGDAKSAKVKITLIDYGDKQFEEKELSRVEECFPFKDTSTVTWVNIDGIHQTDIIEKVGTHFDLHPLILEDIVNTGQRPKFEDFERYLFIVFKMFMYNEDKREVHSEQVSLILGKNFVISFQETCGDVFDTVRDRIRTAKGRVRKMGADYLAYALLDAIVDNYFVIMEKMGEDIEDMEEELVSNPSPATMHTIHGLKRETIFLRKSVWPLREVVNGLERAESKLIQKTTKIFLRDLYDHTIQVIDTVETFRDMISGMVDIYLSSVSNKMNEIMKVLTMIATLFIPLTFIVGLYGMNFNTHVSSWNMPELNWRYGYMFVWGLMLLVVLGMLVYFRRKRWL